MPTPATGVQCPNCCRLAFVVRRRMGLVFYRCELCGTVGAMPETGAGRPRERRPIDPEPDIIVSNLRMPTRYWLMKCEPAAYTIDDLARDTRTGWEGVRNYQARNFMRDDMQEGDPVLFYASNADPSGVTGLARIARAGYPDPFAWKRGHKDYDAASTPANPICTPSIWSSSSGFPLWCHSRR